MRLRLLLIGIGLLLLALWWVGVLVTDSGPPP